MFNKLIEKRLLSQLALIRCGSIKITTPEHHTYEFKGSQPGCDADMVFNDWKVIIGLSQKGDVALAEDYRDGLWHTSDLAALLTFGLENEQAIDNRGNWLFRQFSKVLYFFRKNTVKGSQKNIQAHYDLGNDFYQLWLDDNMTYSSALFEEPEQILEEAQQNKYDRILSRLSSDQGSMLEIGFGWGGFAERALKHGHYDYRGVTLSSEQQSYACQRLQSDQATFVIEDYRAQQGTFDHIVSIEMFEAVGQKYWQRYFDKVKSLLAKDGRAVIQSITVADEVFDVYCKSADMIRTFIFPGGMLPSKGKLQTLCDRAGLIIRDQYAFGQSYAKTLRCWLDRFEHNLTDIRALGYDEAFIRLWRFYLAGCIATFATERTDVVQLELGHA